MDAAGDSRISDAEALSLVHLGFPAGEPKKALMGMPPAENAPSKVSNHLFRVVRVDHLLGARFLKPWLIAARFNWVGGLTCLPVFWLKIGVFHGLGCNGLSDLVFHRHHSRRNRKWADSISPGDDPVVIDGWMHRKVGWIRCDHPVTRLNSPGIQTTGGRLGFTSGRIKANRQKYGKNQGECCFRNHGVISKWFQVQICQDVPTHPLNRMLPWLGPPGSVPYKVIKVTHKSTRNL